MNYVTWAFEHTRPTLMSSVAKEAASENLLNTCFVLFGSFLLSTVSSLVLLLDAVPTPSAYHGYSVNRSLFGVIFLIFILSFPPLWSLFLCSNTRPILRLCQLSLVVEIGTICTISRLLFWKCHRMYESPSSQPFVFFKSATDLSCWR